MNEFMILRTEDALDLPLPVRATPLSAGMDIHANIIDKIILLPGERKRVPAGIKIALPKGYEVQLRPRSGLALEHGVSMVNAPGTIDADYRGELSVLLINHGDEAFIIKRGDRIAQMVICPVVMAEFTETYSLPESVSGDGGFGHSGV